MKNRKFAIVTDSSCDMPKEYYKEHDVTVVNLGFTMNNVNYEGDGGEQISEKDFYAKLREGSMPTTYQITSEMAKTKIEPILEQGKDVLVVAFSSGLSGTAGSFMVAAREMEETHKGRKVTVVDSLCASMGEGLLLDYVIKKADSGASIEETAQYAEQIKRNICHHFTVDNLFHLKRGGRCSSTTAIIGSILKIKPVMHVNDDGKLIVVSKAMGRKKAIACLVERMMNSIDVDANEPIFISHGDCIEDAEYLSSLVKAKLPNADITIHYIGAVIGTHSGCGTLALFHKGKNR